MVWRRDIFSGELKEKKTVPVSIKLHKSNIVIHFIPPSEEPQEVKE